MISSATKPTLVLYTGGTFGMKDDGEGFFTRKARAVGKSPITYDVYEFKKLIDSSLMNQDDWKEIAELIKTYYEKYLGFVVVMGTDTMAYASSALSFMLENLSKPVVFTGAQITIFDALSDGPENLLCSLIVSTLKIPEVLLCFNKKAFRANRVVKIDCMDLNAYDSPNLPPLVTLDTKVTEGERLSAGTGDLRVQEMCPKDQVGLLVIYPGITKEQMMRKILRGEMSTEDSEPENRNSENNQGSTWTRQSNDK